jgi:protein phosphatase
VVVGEDGDDSVPAVAAVAPDFTEPAAGALAADGVGDVPYPGVAPEVPAPGRRERRRARRRQRRMARGRRLITLRTLIFVILLAAVVVGGFAAIRWYNINSYFVGVKDNELIIYQGRIGGFLWYHPVVKQRTGATTADVPASYVPTLKAGVEETSVANARAYVKNLEMYKESLTAPKTPTTTTIHSSTTTKPKQSTTSTTKGSL